jgi:hypothetical protein
MVAPLATENCSRRLLLEVLTKADARLWRIANELAQKVIE